MLPYLGALSVMLALLLGWASVSEAERRGGGRGGHGFHGGRGGGSHGGFQGHRGGRFHGDRRHHGDRGGFHGGVQGHRGGRLHGDRHHHGGFRHHHGHRGFGHHGFYGKAFIGVAPFFLWGPSYIYSPLPAYVPQYWYYCPSARAYYPYVTACPEPWILVPAR